jgi:hypothetical protein
MRPLIDNGIYRYTIIMLKLVAPPCTQPLKIAVIDCVQLDKYVTLTIKTIVNNYLLLKAGFDQTITIASFGCIHRGATIFNNTTVYFYILNSIVRCILKKFDQCEVNVEKTKFSIMYLVKFISILKVKKPGL